ncbi:MAG: zf-HC2 domain-containing protein [Planctomycetota bacterium]
MTPSEARDLIPAYADGELDAARRNALEGHLAADCDLRLEVQRWQGLRRCTQRGISTTTVPDGLAERVRARLRAEAGRPRYHPRVYRLGLSGLAAAAALVAGVTLWPRGAVARPVEARGFADIHRVCALLNHHDTLGVRGGQAQADFAPTDGGVAVARLRTRAAMTGAVPDLSRRGLQLAGACTCSPCPELRVVHAYFRSEQGEIISVFAADGPIALCAAGRVCPCCTHGERRYRSSCEGEVSVVCATVNNSSFVLVGTGRGARGLMDLAEGLPLVALPQVGGAAPAPAEEAE